MTLASWIKASACYRKGPTPGNDGYSCLLGGIYALHHVPTGRRYIGKSWQIRIRVRGHLAALNLGNHACKDLQADFNRDGQDAFELEILEYSQSPNSRLEMRWMAHFHDLAGGIYNSTEGPNLRARELARAVDMEPPNISRLLSGASGRVPETWQKILDELGLELIAVPKQEN